MTLIYKINDLERKIPYKQWEVLKKEFVEFAKEKKQLEENWEQLKQWLEEEIRQSGSKYDRCYYEEFLDKIKELEGGSNE